MSELRKYYIQLCNAQWFDEKTCIIKAHDAEDAKTIALTNENNPSQPPLFVKEIRAVEEDAY